MKLYKCVDELVGREFLLTGRVEVFPRDEQNGEILFSPVRQFQELAVDGMMLEFEVPDYSSLSTSLRPREGSRILPVALSNCERIDAEYVFKLEPKFRLKAVFIAPDCQVTWREARLHLKKSGNKGTVIKILALEMSAEGNVMTVLEQYWPWRCGLKLLKRNINHPSVCDETFIPDVEM